MDRRNFLKSLTLLPVLSLSFHEIPETPFQLYILSSFPEEFLPPILEEGFKTGLIEKRSFLFSGYHPVRNKISFELYKRGWKESLKGIKISFQKLKQSGNPSFTLILRNKIIDPRKGKLFSVWKRMKEKEDKTTFLTVISQKDSSFLTRGKFAKISISGKEIERLPLSTELRRSYICAHGKIIVSIKDGKVWIEESSCHNKICIKTSPVFYTGERIICAPNRFLLEIRGNSGVDTSIG